MPPSSAQPLNPAPEDFAGDSAGRTAKRLFHATRPKFFPASALPVVAGTAWGIYATGQIDFVTFLLALVATVCVHGASNVLNDVGDDQIGTDQRNDQRIYPYTGGSRFIQTGILNSSSMARWGWSLLGIASLAGLALLLLKGPVILLFGVTGIVLAVLYSLGPVRLSSIGIGETAVAAAFGVLPVTGAAWLQGAPIGLDLLLFSLPISAWVAMILFINEVPDIEADAAVGKNTLPVRLGLSKSSLLYIVVQFSAAAVVLLLTVRGALPMLSPLLPLGLLVLAWRASAGIKTGVQDRDKMTKAIESTLAIHTLGSVWLAACALFALWSPAG